MSTVIKELIAKFSADSSGVETGSSKAISAIEGFGKAAVIAGAAAAAAFAALAIHEAKVGDELGKASDRAGEATDKFIELGHATELAGLSTEDLGNVLKFMQKNVYDAAAGNKELEAALKRVGTSSKELLSLDPGAAFQKLATSIGKLGSAAERTKISMELLGRGGTEVLSVAKKGSEYFKAMADEADRFGLTISRVDSEALNDANDGVEKISMAAEGAARQFAVGLAPAISTVTERITKLIDWSDVFRKMGMGAGFFVAQAFDMVTVSTDAVALAVLKLTEYYYDLKATKDHLFGNDKELEANAAMVEGLKQQQEELKKEISDLNSGRGGGAVEEYIKKTGDIIAQNNKLKASSPSKGMGGGVAVPLSQAAIDEANKAQQKYAEQVKKSVAATVEYNNTIADQFIKIKDGFQSGGKAIDIFKQTALNALNEIGNNIIKMAMGGAGGGGIFGSIASSLMGGFGGPLGGGSTYSKQFGRIDWLPSYAVGTDYVPHDMVAQIHEGERIVPKGQNMGGGGTVIQNNNFSLGVSATVRAEMLKLLPQIKNQAVAATRDANARGIGS